MKSKIEDHPMYQQEYVRRQNAVYSWERECNRVDPLPNAQNYLRVAKEELRQLKLEILKSGYDLKEF